MTRLACRGWVPLRRGALLVLLGCALFGCETISQDLNDFASSLMPRKPEDAARQMLDPYDPDARRQGTLLIANSPFGGVDVYVRAYRDMVMHETDPLVKAAAIRALGRHGGVEDAPLIAGHLSDANVQVRREAAKGLQRLHNPEVAPDLLRVLNDETEDPDVRVEAAIALGQYPEDRVFQALVSALEARELAVNLAAERSLEILTGQLRGLEPRAWLVWYNSAAEDPFAQGQDYLYPTYQRQETWLEKLAFWSSPVVEYPAPPAGLRPQSERRTYEDESRGEPVGEAGG
jgi:hypothetical protein